MTKRWPHFFIGSLVLASLAGCGKSMFNFAEREPWRREAEMACLKSGTVRESAGLVRISPIEGPGVCGADFPLKVAMLGSGATLGFADELRPPGGIPGASPQMPQRWTNAPAIQPAASYPPPRTTYPAEPQFGGPVDQGESGNGPVSLNAPGVAPPPDDEDEPAALDDRGIYSQQRPQAYPQQAYPQQQQPLPRLGPAQPQVAAIGPVEVKPAATLACPIVSMLDKWLADAVQPAAMRWFGSPVVEIKQISAYSCRGMNGNPRAHISEHAFGNALDVAGFTLADGRKISVKNGWKGVPEEQGFLRDVQGGACQLFNTVLAPGSNVYHYDHIHVDLMRRSSGRIICQPAAVSGEAIAARAGGRSYANRAEPGVTGSIARSGQPLSYAPVNRNGRGAFSKLPASDDWIEDESHIRDTEK